MSQSNNPKTPEQYEAERRRDAMAYAYRDKDGVLKAINQAGELVAAPEGTPALSAEYAAVAKQTANLMMVYRKVLALSPEQQSLFFGMVRGVNKTSDSLNSEAEKLFSQFKKMTGFEMPGQSLADGIGRLSDSVKLPFQAVVDAVQAGKGVFSELFAHEMTRDDALAIGTAYASAAQKAKESHAAEGFMDHPWAWLSAGVQWCVSWVCERFDALKDKDVMGLNKPGRSFAELYAGALRSDDNQRIEAELQKHAKIGGISGEELAVLTRGGNIATRSGQETTVNAADRAQDAPGDPSKSGGVDIDDPAAVAAQPELTIGGRISNAKDAAVQAVQETAGSIKSLGWGGIAIGTAVTGQGIRGLGEGLARQRVLRPEGKAKKLLKELDRLEPIVKDMEAKKEPFRRGVTKGFWRKQTLQELQQELSNLEADFVRYDDMALNARRNAGSFTNGAMEVAGEGFLGKVWNSPRNLMRPVGDKLYHVLEWGGNSCKQLCTGVKNFVVTNAQRAKQVAEGVVDGAEELVTASSKLSTSSSTLGKWSRVVTRKFAGALAVLDPVRATGQTVVDAVSGDAAGVAVHGTQTAVMATAVAKMGGITGVKTLTKSALKFGVKRAAPVIGAAFSGGELAYCAVKGDTAGVVEHGAELGTIASFAAAGAAIGAPLGGVGAIPGALIGATVGGIASIFTGWGARALYEDSHPAAPQTPAATEADPGIAAAVTEVEQQKNRAAQVAARQQVAFGSKVQIAMGAVTDEFEPIILAGQGRSRGQGLQQ